MYMSLGKLVGSGVFLIGRRPSGCVGWLLVGIAGRAFRIHAGTLREMLLGSDAFLGVGSGVGWGWLVGSGDG